jgi:1-acyl-sn-glycerol-3-phosphate acyltransferase
VATIAGFYSGLTVFVRLVLIAVFSVVLEPVLARWIFGKKETGVNSIKTVIDLVYTAILYGFFVSGSLFIALAVVPTLQILPGSRKTKKLVLRKLIKSVCWFVIYSCFYVKKEIVNSHDEKFESPSIIICNHQSVIDILIILMLNPKLIMLTKDWVWNSPIFGKLARYADYYCMTSGFEEVVPKLNDLIKDGYSIVVFPEGKRSIDGEINRFHKGAFYLAEKFNLDILPIMIHGTADCIRKGTFLVNKSSLTVKYLPRIPNDSVMFGTTYQEKTKQVRDYFRTEYATLKSVCETPQFYNRKLIKNYLYKGFMLERYIKAKLKIEHDYSVFNDIVPKSGHVVDLGCGYGFLDYMLSFLSKDRIITGIDHDKDKIRVANNCISKTDTVNFISSDILTCSLPKADAFLVIDCLHYLNYAQQKLVIEKCKSNLNPGGKIIIRSIYKNLTEPAGLKIFLDKISTVSKFNKKQESGFFHVDPKELAANFNDREFSVETVVSDSLITDTIYIFTGGK